MDSTILFAPDIMAEGGILTYPIFQQQQYSPPPTLPHEEETQVNKRKKKRDKVAQACIICNHDHASCDSCK